jgi:hypothetical protein
MIDMRFRAFISMHSIVFFLQSDWSILNGKKKKMFISTAKEDALISDYSDQSQALVSGGVRMGTLSPDHVTM